MNKIIGNFSIREIVVPVLVFLLLFGWSLFMWERIEERAEASIEGQFNLVSQDLAFNLQARLNDVETRLIGLRAFFNSSENVEKDEWDIFIEEDLLLSRKSGLISVTYIEKTQDTEEGSAFEVVYDSSSFERDIIGLRPEIFNIGSGFLEKHDDNLKDIHTIIEKTILGGEDESVEVILPIYEDMELKTNAQGFLVATIIPETFFNDFIRRSRNNLNFEIYIHEGRDIHHKIFDTNLSDAEIPNRNKEVDLASETIVSLGDSLWILRMKGLREQFSSDLDVISELVLLGGIAIAFLIAWVSFLYMRTTERAEKMAEKLTKDLASANRSIEREKARDEAILRSIGEGLVVTDKKAKILFVNEAFETLLGWKEEEVTGKDISKVIPMRDEKKKEKIEFKEQILNRVLNSREKMATTGVYYFEDSRGRNFPVSITVSPIILKNEVIGAAEVFRDVTKEMEIDRAKTEFVSLASHQLRTPLSTISWYSEMLLAGDAGDISEEQEEYLQEIYKGNQRMIDLVNALLNVSRIEMGTFAVDPEETQLIDIAKSVIEEVGHEIEMKEINLEENYDDSIPKINTDPKLMRIVFQNLLTNAVKYTPESGTIKISMEKEGETIDITVEDNGYGIPKEQHDKVFKKLFRADNVKELDTDGTGLGLYITKSIIERAGGEISFDSKEGGGTAFYVKIPLSGMKKKKGNKELKGDQISKKS